LEEQFHVPGFLISDLFNAGLQEFSKDVGTSSEV
jgi:hypothetical protein